MQDIPEDLHSREYAMHLLEEDLAWPATKFNLELLTECLTALCKSRKLAPVKAYRYMIRAVELAKKQGIAIDKSFFEHGKYTSIRPEAKNVLPLYIPIDRKALEEHKQTPGYQEALADFRRAFKEIIGRTRFPSPGKVER
jgi:hypothetical protein